MSRRRKGLSPTLFPFLAVLVCTLGTLILLLALVTRDAEKQARSEATAKAESKVKAAMEVAHWQRDQLVSIRQKQTEDLEKRRSQLAHVEDHLQRLDKELRALTDRIVAAQEEGNLAAFEAEVERLQAKTLELQKKLAEKKADSTDDGRPPRVAILPYRGPNGTVRRPIYVECVGEYVIIQPEGVRLPMTALRGPLGPGNPLDAALRAARLHWQAVEPTPPYPLLVVRPSGVVAYAAARVAMTAWDDQFGYELVPEDIELEFPEHDSSLQQKMQLALDDALQRRSTLIAAMPERFTVGGNVSSLDRAIQEAAQGSSNNSHDPLQQWRQEQTATTKSMPPGGSAGVFTNQPGFGGSAGNASTQPSSLAASPGGGTIDDLPLAGPNTAAAEGAVGGLGQGSAYVQTKASSPMNSEFSTAPNPGSPENASLLGSSGDFSGNGTSMLSRTGSTTLAANRTTTSASGSGGGDGVGGDASQLSGPKGTSAGGARDNANASQSPSGTQDSLPLDPTQNGNAAGGSAGAPGGSAAAQVAGGQPGGTGMSSSSGESGSQRSTSNSASSSSASANQSGGSAPLASRRGRDWALPDNAKTNGPSVVRHFHVQCYPDRYELESSAGTRVRIPIDPRDPAAAVVKVATTVRAKVESWGPALAGGRWQPVLLADVSADGNQAYAELARLMEGSGVMVKQGTQR